jgi:membrane-bound lytic murein transglycosylase D
MRNFLTCLLSVGALSIGVFTANAQRVVIPADEQQLAIIDSNTIKWRNKLYPSIPAGDLNIYGFEETDVPIYADSVYAYRLALLESEVPLDYNEYVRPYIDLYSIRRRKLTSKVMAWSKYYFPQFEEALDRENMPMELKYLAVIESALNPNATSPVGAAGMWQFMAPTGRMYGLKTTNYYDERRDVQKSTDAAIKYLRNSYRIYGDWLLVIASYNCGPGNVNKAIRKAGGVKNFWAVQQYLPRETRGYVPAFIAATYVMEYAAEHNIYANEDVEVFKHTDTILVDNSYSLNQLALKLNMSVEEIKAYNPALRKGIIPFNSEKIVLTLPYNKVIAFTNVNSDTNFREKMNNEAIALNKQIQTEKNVTTTKGGQRIYKVKKGDNIGAIADRYNVSVSDIRRWNQIKGNKIIAGQKLKIKTVYKG